MHSTTTTQCSDVLESLIELNAYLDDNTVQYCHRSDIMECILGGIVVIEQMRKSTPPELFSDVEQEYIFGTYDRLHDELVSIMT
tara:strand:+ start:3664 stop:3915 length:252 start_codon:yes stop_codon:yes gene_type:complete